MNCPSCQTKSKVIGIKSNKNSIYRMRVCSNCDKKFNSVEKLLLKNITVIKSDRRRENFDENKIHKSLVVATSKRPIPTNAIDAVVQDIIETINNSEKNEVTSRLISKMVISHLSRLDLIAYVRYASSYQDFISINEMSRELEALSSNPEYQQEQQQLFSENYI